MTLLCKYTNAMFITKIFFKKIVLELRMCIMLTRCNYRMKFLCKHKICEKVNLVLSGLAFILFIMKIITLL